MRLNFYQKLKKTKVKDTRIHGNGSLVRQFKLFFNDHHRVISAFPPPPLIGSSHRRL